MGIVATVLAVDMMDGRRRNNAQAGTPGRWPLVGCSVVGCSREGLYGPRWSAYDGSSCRSCRPQLEWCRCHWLGRWGEKVRPLS